MLRTRKMAAVSTWRRASITVETKNINAREKRYEAQRLYASLTVPAHDPQPRSRRTRPLLLIGAEPRDNQFFSQGPNDAITTSPPRRQQDEGHYLTKAAVANSHSFLPRNCPRWPRTAQDLSWTRRCKIEAMTSRRSRDGKYSRQHMAPGYQRLSEQTN